MDLAGIQRRLEHIPNNHSEHRSRVRGRMARSADEAILRSRSSRRRDEARRPRSRPNAGTGYWDRLLGTLAALLVSVAAIGGLAAAEGQEWGRLRAPGFWEKE